MSSRMLDSTAIGCWGRLICRRMLGSGGAWAYTGTTEAAPTSSIAIRITLFMASSKFSPFRGAKSTPRRLVPVVLCPSFSYAAWGVTKRREKPIPTNEEHRMSTAQKQVAVVVGATSKWQSDGRNTKLAHGKAIDDRDIPVGMRWGVGGAIAQKFAREGFFVVLTTRNATNAAALEKAIVEQGGQTMTVELDLVSRESISRRSPRFASGSATRTSWFTTRAISRGGTCRPTRNFWSTSLSRSSRLPSTSPAAGRSWWRRKSCPRCASAAPARS